jgi:Restriction endonuclease fold toxin 5
LGNLAKGVVTAKISPGDALGLAEVALYDAAFPNETAGFRSRVANGPASITEEAEGFAAELYNDALGQVQTGVALAPYLTGPAGSVLGASGIPELIERAKIDIDPRLAQGADIADKTSAAVQTALAAVSLGDTLTERLVGRTIIPDPEPPINEPPPNELPPGEAPPRPPDAALHNHPPPPGDWQQIKESMSKRARDYQEQITGRRDQAYVANGVKFDGVANGRYLEAKGPGYAKFVKNGAFRRWFTGKGLLKQAKAQTEAAQGVPIEWHVADEEFVPVIRQLLEDKGFGGIDVIFTPAK